MQHLSTQIFFSIESVFKSELNGSINKKTINDSDPEGNNLFCFPSRSRLENTETRGKQNVTLFGKTGLNKNSVMHFQCILNALIMHYNALIMVLNAFVMFFSSL